MNSWIMATRPKTLTASFIPVFVGTALAASVQPNINWTLAFCALLCALLIQAGTNFINDALDFKKGADTKERIGPMRVTQSGLLTMQQVHTAGLIAFALALLVGIPLIMHAGWPIAVFLLISVICGYLYTGGPAPLAYVGLGDLFVLLFFGFASTSVVYFLQTGYIDGKSLLAGAQIGFLATALIAINNLRDINQDAKANKRTMAVRFGPLFARSEIAILILLPYILSFIWQFYDYNWASLLPMITLPLAWYIVRQIFNTPSGPIYNKFLGLTALLQLTFGIFLGVSLWLK